MPSRIRIYDSGPGKFVDRYTLVVPSVNEPRTVDMYGFNDAPYHPQGFGQYAGSYGQMGSYSHLGKLIPIDALPEQAQRFVRETITTPLPEGYGKPLPKKWPGSHNKKKTTSRKSGSPSTLRGLRR